MKCAAAWASSSRWKLGRDLGLRLSAEREFSHVGKPINEVKLELRWYYY